MRRRFHEDLGYRALISLILGLCSAYFRTIGVIQHLFHDDLGYRAPILRKTLSVRRLFQQGLGYWATISLKIRLCGADFTKTWVIVRLFH